MRVLPSWAGRAGLLVGVGAVGFALAASLPGATEGLRRMIGMSSRPAPSPAASAKPASDVVRLAGEQIAASGIETAAAGPGQIGRRLTVPGTVKLDPDRVAHVAVKLVATVAELRKRVGDVVTKGEVIATLESRELAAAKSEFLEARLTNELEQENLTREKALWAQRISAEKEFLRVRNVAAQSAMRYDIARQKLFALGLDTDDVERISTQSENLLRQQTVRAPIAGEIVERRVNLGAALGRDNLETELFTIADLSRVWIEMAVGAADLGAIKTGQPVALTSRETEGRGKVILVSPIVDAQARTARVVVEAENEDRRWRPGAFVTCVLTLDERSLALSVPSSAVLMINGETAVFVRSPDGFRRQAVQVGRHDDRVTEILSGLSAGEAVAVQNAFLLKAEFLKSLAED